MIRSKNVNNRVAGLGRCVGQRVVVRYDEMGTANVIPANRATDAYAAFANGTSYARVSQANLPARRASGLGDPIMVMSSALSPFRW